LARPATDAGRAPVAVQLGHLASSPTALAVLVKRSYLDIAITEIGSKAKMAAFGMKRGCKSQPDALERHLGH
jgi:hypothetical protein